MSSRRRLIAGFWATALGPFVTLLVQVLNVPLFLRYWGPHMYGEWLILSAIPMYLSISDMGFGSVAGNDMAMRVARGDREGAVETFQSTSALVLIISIFVGLIAGAILLWMDPHRMFGIREISSSDARIVLCILCIYSLGVLQASVLLSGFRSDGLYPLGAFSTNIVRLSENVLAIGVVLFHCGPIAVASAMAGTRVLGTVILYFTLYHKLAWLEPGLRKTTLARIKELTRPALAFMAFPIGNALSIQGVTILIGLTLGPLAVAVFTPMRTLSRLPYQVIDSLKNAVWPELSTSYGMRDFALARKIHRYSCKVAFWFAFVAVLGLAAGGPFVFRIWTGGRIHINLSCYFVLLLVVVASSLWNASSAVPVAANRHEWLALQYLVGTAGSLVLGYYLIFHFGLTGVAIALLASDLWMGMFVVPASNALLEEDNTRFLLSMLDFRQLASLVKGQG
jgi:O-antigen/teichoic acid export membrane protein